MQKKVLNCPTIKFTIIGVLIALCMVQSNTLIAQCDPGVPAFIADLRGNPDSIWISPNTSRSDNCCGTSNPDRCIKFTVYLDAGSQGIRFGFASGAVPSGSLFYQIGCGTSYAVGADICLSGAGPHELTFCKPGNNANEYSITAIPAPSISPNVTVSMACVDTISISGLVKDSITWAAYPANATYDGYLNCTSGCDTVIVTPTGIFPDSVTYVACGPIKGGCAGSTYCDTVTVYFVTDLAVQIQPANPTLCFGDTATTITAHGTGGLAPYRFSWSHIGGSGQGDSVQYVDTGTYIVSLLDSLGCSFAYDTVVVTGYSDSILAIANDTNVCRRAGAIQLNGTVQQATGGRWVGGGTFTPSDSILNPTYTLSGAELNAGFTQLLFITTGNGTCPADTDVVMITVRETPPGTLFNPLDTICQYDIANYTADPTVGDTITWAVSGGTIVSTNNYNKISVQWDTVGVGIVQMYRSSLLYGCDTTVYDSIVVLVSPTPVISGPDSACEFETVVYTIPADATQTFNWTVNGGSIVSGQSSNSVNVFWNSFGMGVISVTVANSNGCDSAVSDSILIIQKPTPSISGFDTACHNKIYTYTVPNVVGNTYNWTITNGSILSGQGTNSATILWGTIGTGIVNLTQTSAFGCDSTVSDTIVILYTPAPIITGDDSVCSNKIKTYTVPAVGGDSYLWAVGNGTIISGQGSNSIDVLWGNIGAGTVSITQTSPAGCDSTVLDSIVVFYTPAPVLTGADSNCRNTTSTYSVPLVGGDTYNWVVTNGTILSGQSTNSINVFWGTLGAGTVAVTQTSPFGCDSTVSKNVTTIYTPAPVITGNDTACQNKQYTFSTPLVGGDTYNWAVTNGTITSGQGTNSIIAVFDTIGAGVVSITQTSALGCDSTITDTIVTVYTPAPVLTAPDTSCRNKTYTFSVPNVAGDTYNWLATNGSILAGQGTSSIIVAFDTVGTGTVSITQTSPFGCDSVLSTTVTILYTPAPIITGEDSVCHNNIYTYSTSDIVSDTYNWTVNNGTILSGQSTNSIDILWGTAGIGTVSLTQSSPLSCDSTVLDSIIILYTPAPVISGPDSVCEYKITSYSVPPVAGDIYNWQITNGTIISGQSTASISVLWDTASAGTVAITQTSPLGCDSAVYTNITVLYTPVPKMKSVDTACRNKGFTFAVDTASGDNFTWTVTNGTITSGQGTSRIIAIFDTVGSGIVTVTQASPLGCDSTISDTVIIVYTPAPVITGEDSACHNNIYTYTTPNVVDDSYTWSVNNGTIITGQSTNSVDILWGTAGVGTVQVTQTSSMGCDSTVLDSIVILYTPAPVITGEDSACHNNIYTYTTPSVVGDSYTWSVNNGTIITGQSTNSIDILWGTAGVGTVQVTQTSSMGCDSTVLDSIVILYTPAPVITGEDSACHNNIYTYTTPNVVGDSYTWSVNNGTIITGQSTNSVDILWGTAGVGTVQVTQTSPLGCDSTVLDSIVILYTPAPVITGEDSACHNNIYTYTTPLVVGDSYTWSVNNGTIITGQSTNSVDILWGTAGVGTVQVTQTSPLGCDSTVLDSIVILYTPAPVITGVDSACQNKIYTYTTPNVVGDNYTWVVTNGTIITGQGTNSIDVMLDTVGRSVISITQTSPLGCDSTVSDTINVIYTPAPVLIGTDTVCHNNIYTYSVPNIVGDTFSWSVTNGTILTGQGTNSVDVLWGTAGNGNISVTQTSPFGCDSTLSASITILYTPAPVITGVDSACQNKIYTYSTPSVGSDSYTWTITNGTIIAGQGTNSIDVMLDTVGRSVISITQTSPLGCDSTVTDTINVIYTPAPVLSGADTVCHNNIYTYSVPNIVGDTFSWSVTNGTILTGQGTNSVDVLWGAAGNGNVSVTQTSPFGCDSTLSATITILYTPAPVITGVDSACQNKIYTFTTPSVGGDSYTWTLTNGTIIAGQGTNSIDVMLDTVGSSVISIIQTSPLGCDSTITDTIKVLYTPAPTISGPDTSCHNKIQTYSVPFVPTDTYSWAVSNGTIISGQNTNTVDVLWGTAGVTGSILATQTSASGCDSTVGYNVVVVLYTPSPVITGEDSACHNKPYTYSVPSVAGDVYVWTVSNGIILSGQNTNTIAVLWDTVGTGTISINQTSPLGCDSTITRSIDVLYTPAPVVLGNDTVCHNKIYTYSVTNIAGDSYNWSVTNGTILSGQSTNSIDVLWGAVGNGSIAITQTSPLGCDSTISANITILYTPAPVITGDDSVCHNNIYTYSVPNIVGDTFSWSVTNGTILTGQGTNSVDVLWGTAGAASISVTQTSPLSCDSTITLPVLILYTPAPVITGVDSACQNKIYTYTTPSIAGDSYNWVVTNGTIIAGQGTNSIDVMLDTVGSSVISIIQTSPLGCDSTVTDTINVIYTPAPVLTGADTVCHNNIYTYSVDSIAGDTFSWSVSNGTILIGQGTNSVDVLWGAAGNGNISVTQTSPFGCDSTLSASITILYTPAPIITGADSACQNKIYTYTTPSIAGDSYTWTVSNGTIITGQGTNSIDVMLDTVGSSVISITQTSPLGCDSTVSDTINVIYTPAPVLIGADTVCHNNIYTYSVDSISGDSYTWNVTNGTILTGQGTSSVDVLWGAVGSGNISVTQTSPFGCDSTLSATITILYTPAPTIVGANSVCQNKIYSYRTANVIGDSYNWVVTNGTIISGQGTNSIDVMLDTIGSSVVSITQSSPLGCDSTVTKTINVVYTPAPTISGPDTSCHNDIKTYAVPNVVGDSYSWNITNGTILTGQGTNSVDVLWGSAGVTGSILTTQTSPFGCDSTVGYNVVVVLYTPAPVITGNDSVCDNNIYTYSTPAVAGDSYTWTVTGGTILTGDSTNSIDVVWNGVGTGSVAIYQISPLGCDSTVTLPIRILYTPAPVITGIDSACQNKIYTYSTPSIAGDGYLWTVSNGTIIAGQGTNSIDVMLDTVGSSVILVTQTSPLGCDSTVTDTINVIYTPAPVLTGADTVCHNNIYTYSVPNIVGDTFTWSVSNGTILTGQGTNSIDVLWGTAGSGNISVTQTSPFGCDSTLSATITILYTPAPVIIGADSACQNKIYTYSAPNVVGDSYTWVVTNGTIITGQGTNSIDVMLDTVGSSVISITQTSPLGCDSIVTDTINVIYTPVPLITGPDTTCHNKIQSYTVPNVAGDSYTWNVTNGTIITGQSTNSIDVLWGIAGAGSLSVTQTSASGCDSTVGYNVVVILYTPAPIMVGADSACHNKPYNYLAPNVFSDTYNWTITNGVIIGGQGTSNVTVVWDTVGMGTISLTQTSPLGCDSTISRTIDILYTPNPLISGDDTACHNKIYTYNVPASGSDTYNWVVTNGTIIAGQNTNMVDVLWGNAGIGTIGITQTSNIGCDSTLVDTITILYSPAPVIAGNDSACFNSIHTYSVQNIVGDTFTWVVTSGTIISGQGTDSIEVLWAPSGNGNIFVTQTSPYGCDSAVNLPVQLLYMPTPVIFGLDTVCHNKIYNYNVPFVTGDSYNWVVANGSIVAGQGTNSIDIMWGAPGLGTLTLTQTSNLGCDTTITDTATILYSPNPQIQGNDTVCFEQVHTYHVDSIGLDTYQWTVSNGTILTGQGTDTITVQWNTVGNGFVRITQTSPQGCDSVMTLPVNIRYRPTPQLSGTTLVCSNKIITYSTPASAGDSYVWTAINGTIINGQGTNTVDIMWNLTDTGYIYVDQISALGCDSMVFDTITIRPSPAPVLLGDDTVCHNKIGFYSVDSLPSHTYQWTINGGTLLSGQATSQISVIWGAAGTGRVSVTQTSDLGCDSSMFADIVIQPSPSPVISSPDTVCNNKIYQHSVSSIAGNTYLWQVINGAIVSDSTTNTVSILWGVTGKGYVSILQTSALGCDSLIRDSVIIVGSPNPQINGPDTVCHNKITAYTISPAPVNNTYQWTVTNGTILSGQGTSSISILWGAAGTPAAVSILQTNIYGCDSLKTKPIHIDPTPAPIIQGSINICSQNFEYYTVTPQAGHTYSWSVTGGALMSPIDSAAARVNWGAPGLGSVRITQTNQYGCDSTYTLPITIRQGPVRLITGPDTVCENTAYNYAATNTQAGDIYTWSVTGGTIQGANNAAQVNILWNTVGLQRVRLEITNSFGCDSLFEMAVQVFDLPVPDLRGSDKACSNSKDNLFKNYKYNSTQAGNLKYTWSISGGGVITTGINADSILVDWNNVGNHTVNLTIEDIVSGCIASQSLVVRVDSLHVPEIIASGLNGCAPMHVKFTEKENSDLLSYQWLIDGLGFRTEKEPEVTYYKQGPYNARVIVTNDVGCVDTAILQVIVRPSPKADFIINKDVLVYEEDTAYFTNTSVGAVKYQWTFHDSNTDSGFNASKYYTWPGKYPVQLVAINEYGCPDTVVKLVNVVVKPIIFVPNAITPNGDFNNDYFEVSTYFVTELEIMIFNRWGEIIFRSNDVNFKWDANYKGIPVQQDVYAYYIVARGFNHELIVRSGNVTVLR